MRMLHEALVLTTSASWEISRVPQVRLSQSRPSHTLTDITQQRVTRSRGHQANRQSRKASRSFRPNDRQMAPRSKRHGYEGRGEGKCREPEAEAVPPWDACTVSSLLPLSQTWVCMQQFYSYRNYRRDFLMSNPLLWIVLPNKGMGLGGR